MLQRLFRFLGTDIAMDLGTANTLIYMKKRGIVINEPSVVALDAQTGDVIAVGHAAKEFLGRTPQRIKAIRPMRDGVIADYVVTQQMISTFLQRIIPSRKKRFFGPNIAICIPTGITQVEKRAVIEAANQAGAREVRLIEEPMAAAIGAGMPIEKPLGNMIVDIGGGTTEVAVISLSAVAYAESVRVAGDAMDQAIQRFFQEEHRLLIGDNMAERVKKVIGSASEFAEEKTITVSGKNLVSGTPDSITVNDGDIREALKEPVRYIVEAVFRALEKTPPELAADIGENGILLAGGGSLLAGLDVLLSKETRLPVRVDAEPLTTVVRGTGRSMEERSKYEQVYIN